MPNKNMPVAAFKRNCQCPPPPPAFVRCVGGTRKKKKSNGHLLFIFFVFFCFLFPMDKMLEEEKDDERNEGSPSTSLVIELKGIIEGFNALGNLVGYLVSFTNST